MLQFKKKKEGIKMREKEERKKEERTYNLRSVHDGLHSLVLNIFRESK